MTDVQRYFKRLATNLRLAGVDGRSAGELIAELEEYLESSGTDPVEEFGPVLEFSKRLVAERRVNRSVWWRRVGIRYVGEGFAIVGVAMLTFNMTAGAIPLQYLWVANRVLWILAIVLGIHALVRLKSGGNWRVPLFVGLGVFVARIADVSMLIPRRWIMGRGLLLSANVPLAIAAVCFAIFVATLLISRNPMRFPSSRENPADQVTRT